MKVKILLSAFLLSVFASAASSYAVENLSVEPGMASRESASNDTFRAVVTGDGKLILKPGPVFTEGGNTEGFEMPYLISHAKSIDYPRWALHQGWQGEFVIAIEILPAGNMGRSHVMKSTGYKILDEAAADAVQTWQFRPAMKNGKPVLTCIQIPVRFQIDTQASF